jgi:hypothetical protein
MTFPEDDNAKIYSSDAAGNVDAALGGHFSWVPPPGSATAAVWRFLLEGSGWLPNKIDR